MREDRYEFAISITDQEFKENPLFYVNSYNFRSQGIITLPFKYKKPSRTFLTLECKSYIEVINIWKRKNKVHARLFNPSDKPESVMLTGKKIKNGIKELILRGGVIAEVETNIISMKPGEIKTLPL